MSVRYSDRSVLLYMGTEVERMGEAFGADEETIRDGIRLCGDVLRSGYAYDSVDSVASTCFYLACKRLKEPISLPDIADESRKSQKNIQHLSANLISTLEIQLTPTGADTYLEDGIDEFGLTDELADECFEILEQGRDRNLHSGLAPTTVAGAVLYAVAKKHRLDIQQREIAEFAGKTTVSIRNSYKPFLKLADNVPVDVLPPQTIEEALATLRTQFPDHPSVYADDACDVAHSKNVQASASRAGVAGGAYLTVARAHGEDIGPDELSSIIGLGSRTVERHAEGFQYDH